MFEVAISLCILSLYGIYRVSKNNSGKLKCKGTIGKLLDHSFLEDYGDRVCRICGLVQKEEAAGILASEGDTWYDKGYAENKEELINYLLDLKRARAEKYRKWDEEHRKEILNKKISVPNRKVATKAEDVV